MRQTGPFYYKSPNGDSDIDLYEREPLLNWVIWLLVIFYAIIIIFYIGILINNVVFRYTYVDPSLPTPGTLISDRYDIYWVSYLLTVIVSVLFPSAVLMMILYRNNYGCNVVWFSGILLLMVFHVFSLFIQTIDYIQCDGPCSRDFNTFLWIYWLNVMFLIVHLLYATIIGLYWASNIPFVRKQLSKPEPEPDQNQVTDVESRMVTGGYQQQQQKNRNLTLRK